MKSNYSVKWYLLHLRRTISISERRYKFITVVWTNRLTFTAMFINTKLVSFTTITEKRSRNINADLFAVVCLITLTFIDFWQNKGRKEERKKKKRHLHWRKSITCQREISAAERCCYNIQFDVYHTDVSCMLSNHVTHTCTLRTISGVTGWTGPTCVTTDIGWRWKINALHTCVARLTIHLTGVNITFTKSSRVPSLTCAGHVNKFTVSVDGVSFFWRHHCPPCSQAHMVIMGFQVRLAPLSSVATNDKLN